MFRVVKFVQNCYCEPQIFNDMHTYMDSVSAVNALLDRMITIFFLQV